VSYIWWTKDGKLEITSQDPPPKVRKKDAFIALYLFVLHSVTCLKIDTSLLVLRHYEHLFLFLFWRRHSFAYICWIFITLSTHFQMHIQSFKCTYRSTHAQAHMYNQHTRQMATTMHRSLVWRGRRKAFVRDKGLAHTTKRGKKNGQKNPTFTNLKKKIRAHRASSRKATRLFLTR